MIKDRPGCILRGFQDKLEIGVWWYEHRFGGYHIDQLVERVSARAGPYKVGVHFEVVRERLCAYLKAEDSEGRLIRTCDIEWSTRGQFLMPFPFDESTVISP